MGGLAIEPGGRSTKACEMLHRCRRIAIFAVLAATCGGLGGCADSGSLNIPFPDLSATDKVKSRLLSNEEKDAAIGDLTREQASHRDAAIKEIEKR